MLKATYTWDNATASGQRNTTENHGRLGGIRQTPGYLQKQPCHLPEGQVYNSCVLSAMTYGADTWTLTKQAQNKLATAQTKMERSMLNITYKDRKTNVWVREKKKVIDINQQCEKDEMVLSRAYQPPQRRPMDHACYHLETI